MAREVIQKVVDDLDGSPDAATIAFGLDGRAYEIDLGPVNEATLRRALDPYLAAARRVRDNTGRAGRPVADTDRNAAIRQWALDSGVQLPQRGRIANAVQDAYTNRDVVALYTATGL